jgi:hypothetical protein
MQQYQAELFKIWKIEKSGKITPYLERIAHTIGAFLPLICLLKINILPTLFSKLKFLILH